MSPVFQASIGPAVKLNRFLIISLIPFESKSAKKQFLLTVSIILLTFFLGIIHRTVHSNCQLLIKGGKNVDFNKIQYYTPMMTSFPSIQGFSGFSTSDCVMGHSDTSLSNRNLSTNSGNHQPSYRNGMGFKACKTTLSPMIEFK